MRVARVWLRPLPPHRLLCEDGPSSASGLLSCQQVGAPCVHNRHSTSKHHGNTLKRALAGGHERGVDLAYVAVMTTAALSRSEAAIWPRLSTTRIALTRAQARAAALTIAMTLPLAF